MSVITNFNKINSKIIESCKIAKRNSDSITLIAVTKNATVEKTNEILNARIFNLGENRDQPFLNKWSELNNDNLVWHFIGTLQSRKVKNIINNIDYLHSLDRISLAEEIEKRADKKIKCFVQVNTSGEDSKFGLQPDATIDFILQLKQYSKIEVVGLMTMAPNTRDETVIRNCFKRLKSLQNEVQKLQLDKAPCNELSMGMSNDYQIAIEEGATMIRVGSALIND